MIVGRVSKVDSTVKEAPTSVYTVFDVQVLEALKSTGAASRQIKMIQFGSTGSRFDLVVENSPLAKVGTTYLLFLTKDKFSTEERYAVLGGSQGRMVVSGSGKLDAEVPLSAQQGAIGKTLAEIKQRLNSN